MLKEIAAAALFCTPTPGVAPESVVAAYSQAYNDHDAAAMRRRVLHEAVIRVWTDEAAQLQGEYPAPEILNSIEHTVFVDTPNIHMSVSGRTVVGARVAQAQSYAPSGNQMLAVYTVIDGCIVAVDSYW